MDNQPKLRPHIWLISQYFTPDVTAAAFRMDSCVKFLAGKGYRVSVITTAPHRGRVPEGRSSINPEWCRVKRIRLFSRRPLLRYIEFFFRALGVVTRRSLINRCDAVIATSPPLGVLLVGRAAAALNRACFLCDIRDLWPDAPAALNMMRERSRLYGFFTTLERRMYRRADGITCVARPMAREIRRRGGKRVFLLYNGIEKAIWERAAHSPPPRPAGKPPWHVVYYGNIGLAQNLASLIRAAADLGDSRLRVTIIGEGVLKSRYRDVMLRQDITNLEFRAPMSWDQLYRFVASEADLLFINLVDRPVFHATIPSKLFHYLLHRLPVISGLQGEGAEILASTGAVIPCMPGVSDSQPLSDALKRADEAYGTLLENAAQNNLTIARGFVREELLESVWNEFDAERLQVKEDRGCGT